MPTALSVALDREYTKGATSIYHRGSRLLILTLTTAFDYLAHSSPFLLPLATMPPSQASTSKISAGNRLSLLPPPPSQGGSASPYSTSACLTIPDILTTLHEQQCATTASTPSTVLPDYTPYPRVKDLSRDQLLQLIADMYQDTRSLELARSDLEAQVAARAAENARLVKMMDYQSQVLEVTKKEVIMLRQRVTDAQAEIPLMMMKRAMQAAKEEGGGGDQAGGRRGRTVVMVDLPLAAGGVGR